MNEYEIRKLEGGLTIETRADGQKLIVGRAIVFNSRSQNLGGFVEQIDPDSLAETDMGDTVALFNHDPNFVLGRVSAGTLVLKRDAQGLVYEITPPDTEQARSLVKSIERGDVKGSSFGFTISAGGSDWNEDPNSGVTVRTVKKIARLYDVSPVTYPAYTQTDTSIAKRSLEEFKQALQPDNSWMVEAEQRELEYQFP
jgi:uncharacterized protein